MMERISGLNAKIWAVNIHLENDWNSKTNDFLVVVRRSCNSAEDDSALLQHANEIKTKITFRKLLTLYVFLFQIFWMCRYFFHMTKCRQKSFISFDTTIDTTIMIKYNLWIKCLEFLNNVYNFKNILEFRNKFERYVYQRDPSLHHQWTHSFFSSFQNYWILLFGLRSKSNHQNIDNQ